MERQQIAAYPARSLSWVKASFPIAHMLSCGDLGTELDVGPTAETTPDNSFAQRRVRGPCTLRAKADELRHIEYQQLFCVRKLPASLIRWSRAIFASVSATTG